MSQPEEVTARDLVIALVSLKPRRSNWPTIGKVFSLWLGIKPVSFLTFTNGDHNDTLKFGIQCRTAADAEKVVANFGGAQVEANPRCVTGAIVDLTS